MSNAELGFVSSNSLGRRRRGLGRAETFWIQRRAAEPSEELGFTAEHVVHALTDLPALVRG